ncbi:TPA: hypothetical protein KSK27_002332 [Clostridioides difficile]|nr:hypothetical protein [Clostridioides difficile]
MSDSLAGIDKVHELTIRYLDANYDLKGKTVEEYAYEYESLYHKIYHALREAHRTVRAQYK